MIARQLQRFFFFAAMKRAIVARLIGDTNQKSEDLRYNVIDGL